jgi:hypothetical protein
MNPKLDVGVELGQRELIVSCAITNNAKEPLYLNNVFYKLPPHLQEDEARPYTREVAHLWRVAEDTAFLHQGTFPNYSAASLFSRPDPFYSRVGSGETHRYRIVLPLPLVEWDWCAAMVWPELPTISRPVSRLRVRIDGVLTGARHAALDGFPQIFPNPRWAEPKSPYREVFLRAAVDLPRQVELLSYPRGDFLPIREPDPSE